MMTEISTNPNVNSLPAQKVNAIREEKRRDVYATQAHIDEEHVRPGVKMELSKYENALLDYFPKGFMGSKNSDFYEFLTIGKIPYLIGSILLIALYSSGHKQYNSKSAFEAGKVAKKMGAGVIFYGIGKWLTKKIAHTGIKASTGVDLDMKYENIVNELPENGKQVGLVRKQYPGVFDSADFPRKDLIAQDSELNHGDPKLVKGDIYYHEDRIAKKMGYKNRLNAPNQIVWPKIRELKVRTTALENITQYLTAATGVAFGCQKAFEDFKPDISNIKLNIGNFIGGAKDKIVSFFKNFDKQKLKPSNIIDSVKTSVSSLGKSISNERLNGKTLKNSDIITDELKNASNSSKGFINSVKSDFKTLRDAVGSTYIGAIGRLGKNKVKSVFQSDFAKKIVKTYKEGIIHKILCTSKNALQQLWQGNNRNIITRNYGKALIIGTVASTILTWLIPTLAFKKNPNNMKSKVNAKKEYEVC